VVGPSTPDGWIPTEKTWPVFWALMAVIPVLLVQFLTLFDYLGLLATVGPSGTLEAIIAGIVITVFGELLFLAAFRTAAIRIQADGLVLKMTLRKSRRVDWSSLQVAAARPAGYGVLHVNGPRGGFYTLSPKQYAALRTCPQAGQSTLSK
jgi:hypothetical protein